MVVLPDEDAEQTENGLPEGSHARHRRVLEQLVARVAHQTTWHEHEYELRARFQEL